MTLPFPFLASLSVLLLPFIFLACLPSALALNNGLALRPQMGWNTWEFAYCNINETLVRSSAQVLINSGLAAVGYTYVNLDDWYTPTPPHGHLQSPFTSSLIS